MFEEELPEQEQPEQEQPGASAPSSHATRIVAVCVGLVLVAFIGLLAFGGGEESNSTSRLLGRRVPQIQGTAMDGSSYDIDDSRGRWVLVNFFATWCPPCVAEHPDLVALEAWGEETDQLDLVAIVFNDSEAKVQDFFNEYGGNWPVINDSEPAISFQIQAVPETFLVDPFGVVQVHFTGGLDAEEVIAIIEEAS